MTTFTFDTNDADHLAGISAARDAYNLNNPQNPQADDQAFFEWMASSQFAVWASGNIGRKVDTLAETLKSLSDAKLAEVQAAIDAVIVKP